MFGSIGGAEILMILTLALLLFGPRRLPQIGRTVGRALAEFRRATQELKTSLEREVELEQVRGAGAELRAAGRDLAEGSRQAAALVVARGALAESPRPAGVEPGSRGAGGSGSPQESEVRPAPAAPASDGTEESRQP